MNNIHEKNEKITCPVCNRTFESLFARDGHLRLTMDPAHRAFRQQQNEIVSDAPVPIIPVTPRFAGDKLINVLEDFVKDQERLYEQEAKKNELMKQLKEMIQGERENEKAAEREKIQAELIQQYDQDVENAVAQRKEGWEQSHQKEINDARLEAIQNGVTHGFIAAAIMIPDPSNSQYILVAQNSPLHTFIIELVNDEWVIHPEKCRWIYEQQYKFLKENPIKVNTSITLK